MKITKLLIVLICSLYILPTYAVPDFLVDAEWLEEHLQDDNLVILEVRYHPHRYYRTDLKSKKYVKL